MKAILFFSIFILIFAMGCADTQDSQADQPEEPPVEDTGVDDVFTDDDSAVPPQVPES